jgi:hypothetical protein
MRLAIAFSLAALLTVLPGATAFARLTRITNEWTDFESITLSKLTVLRHAKDDVTINPSVTKASQSARVNIVNADVARKINLAMSTA